MDRKHAAMKKAGNFQQGRQKRERFDKKKIFPKQRKKGELVEEEINCLKDKYETTDTSELNAFKDFPLCFKTQKGLQNAGYIKPTDIQREAIPLALRGSDILGAAKTGSGKTLAFLIPALECLYRLKWSADDGLGALIITPTRELAYQIYEMLRKLGRFHDFSAGLVIGGKHLREEAARIQRTNIVICTPGRLQQHLDETPYFSADTLQMLVLDEADRILDLGFQQCMNAIIEQLPIERQTLLFSATQTKSVKDLARLSLKEPMYVSVHEMAKHSTPANLRQSYIVCEQHEKLDMLWSFVKNHLKYKTLVFLTSCKQVRFVFEAFRRMRPGVTVLSLHGAMHQLKRIEVYDSFCRKRHAVLFATDIAARGLDFPSINWVVQLDCPEDANTYIHRAGRTARYETDGEALLVLLPSEEQGMLKKLEEKKIPINNIKVNVKKMTSIQKRLESFCAAEVQLKEFAQRCFVSYMKAVYLMKNKEVFDVTKIDTDSYAASLGLAIPPRVRFIQRKMQKFSNKEVLTNNLDNVFRNPKEILSGEASQQLSGSEGEESESEESETEIPVSKNSEKFDVGGEDFDDILTVKKKDAVKVFESDEEEESSEEEEDVKAQNEQNESKKKKNVVVTKAKLAKKLQRKNIKVNTKVTFDEEGEEVLDRIHITQADFTEIRKLKEKEEEDEERGGIDIELAKKRMEEEDKVDKQLFRERVRRRHREKRLKEKEERRREQGQGREEEKDLDDIDLSLLPDPDKIYGKDTNKEDDDDESPPTKKMRTEESDEESSEAEDESDDQEGSDQEESGQEESEGIEQESDEEESGNDEPMAMQSSEGVSLEDDEALALRLLG